jgi:hypothetical protein
MLNNLDINPGNHVKLALCFGQRCSITALGRAGSERDVLINQQICDGVLSARAQGASLPGFSGQSYAGSLFGPRARIRPCKLA